MKTHYDIVFLTNIPAFYKVNLWNEISVHKTILVIFSGDDDGYVRNKDFAGGEMRFEHIYLSNNRIKGVRELKKLFNKISYDELIITGNSVLTSWYAAFTSSRTHNSITIESSIYESTTNGIKGFVKRIFISRFSKAYCSGQPHSELVKNLGFRGEISITQGVGLFNYIEQPKFRPCSPECNKLIYVGRLSEEKNLKMLIHAVARHPEWILTIIGYGPQKDVLEGLGAKNVRFVGAVDNRLLPGYYQQSDVFVLPSKSEPWGLVVEEALNNGIPVAVSNKVGCCIDRVKDLHCGIIFSTESVDEIEAALVQILSPKMNNALRMNIAKLNFKEIASYQVGCYL